VSLGSPWADRFAKLLLRREERHGDGGNINALQDALQEFEQGPSGSQSMTGTKIHCVAAHPSGSSLPLACDEPCRFGTVREEHLGARYESMVLCRHWSPMPIEVTAQPSHDELYMHCTEHKAGLPKSFAGCASSAPPWLSMAAKLLIGQQSWLR
jgi:hypothetical protein